jgi:hypothetical protein
MTKEQIIQWAHDAGAQFDHMTWVERDLAPVFQRFAELVAAHERNKLAAWMIQFGFATGHGDTMEELVDALGTEIVDRIDGEVEAEREACAKKAGEFAQNWWSIHCDSNKHMETTRKAHDDFCALQSAIRARGQG